VRHGTPAPRTRSLPHCASCAGAGLRAAPASPHVSPIQSHSSHAAVYIYMVVSYGAWSWSLPLCGHQDTPPPPPPPPLNPQPHQPTLPNCTCELHALAQHVKRGQSQLLWAAGVATKARVHNPQLPVSPPPLALIPCPLETAQFWRVAGRIRANSFRRCTRGLRGQVGRPVRVRACPLGQSSAAPCRPQQRASSAPQGRRTSAGPPNSAATRSRQAVAAARPPAPEGGEQIF
jgi:hypothetical protein